ncbi:MAG: rRNA maturation RNase YbeY [Synergistaceae bacterium]|nr:rRNA maturation RNase YbeY [Synergistaceae bacterium]
MKLQLNIDASEDGDPQSFFSPSAVKNLERVFEDELPLFYPDVGQYAQVEISVSFLNGAEMREINEHHRNMDEPTDVLSFPLWEEDGRFVPEGLPELLPLGDILICPEEVRRIHSSLPYGEALCLVLAHGFLHLLAWDHDTLEKEQAMWERQADLKSKLLRTLEEVC